MVPVTTPQSPRNQWPQRQFRMDAQTWKAITGKLSDDELKWQTVMETMARDWLAGNYDVAARREALKAEGKLPD